MPDEAPKIPRLTYNELGGTGLKRAGGSVYEEFLPQLQGSQGVRKYTEMANNSAIVGAVVFAIESLLRSVEWTVEPSGTSPAEVDAAKFLEECRTDMSHSWEDFISEVVHGIIVYGWAYFEIVYKQRQGTESKTGSKRSRYDDGMVGWRKFSPRAHETLWKWRFDKNGGIKGMWQYPQPQWDDDGPGFTEPVYIPIEKALLFRSTSRKNNPEGRSMLRTAYRAYHFATRMEEIEAIGIDRDLAGLPVARVPIEILAADRSSEATATYNFVKDLVTRVRRDEQEGVIFPMAYDEDGNSMFEFELLTSGGRRTFDTTAVRQSWYQAIAQSVLADFLLLGHEATGSFALSSDKTELFAVAMGSILDQIESTINRHAVPRLFELNGLPTDANVLPQLRHGDIENPDLQSLGGYVTSIQQAGAAILPDYKVENHLRRAASLPEVSPEEYEEKQMLKQQQQMMMGGMFGGGGVGGPEEQEPTPNGNGPPAFQER